MTAEHLSSRHQELLQVSPLLRNYCAETLLTLEEEQQLFQQIATTQRQIFLLMLRIHRVREEVILLLNEVAVAATPTQRLGNQLRGLASSGVLAEPLSTDAYLDHIEEIVEQQLKQINQSSDHEEQLRWISDLILHPDLRKRVEQLYREHYPTEQPNESKSSQYHQRIHTLREELEQLKERVVQHNLRLVIKHAVHYAKHHLDIHDLIQEGALGLMHACDLYDYRRGYKFSTYASRWVLQTILNLLNEITFTVQIPRSLSQAYRKVHQYIDEQVKKTGHTPSPMAIAEALEIDETEVDTVLNAGWVANSLNTPLGGEEEGTEMLDMVEDEAEDAYEKVDLFLQYRVVKQLIEQIPSTRDREILKMRFAIGYGESTLEEIAATVELTKERVRQIINHHVKLMKQMLEEGPLPSSD